MNGGWPLEDLRLRALSCRAVFAQCVQTSPEKTLKPEFCFAAAVLAGPALQHVGLAGSPQRRSNLTATSAGAPLPQRACCWPCQQITALIEQDPRISFQFGLWKPQRAPSVRAQTCWCCRGEWLALRRRIYLQSEEQCLAHPGAGRVTDGTSRDGSAISTRPPRVTGFPGSPLLRFPEKPQGFPPQILDPASR